MLSDDDSDVISTASSGEENLSDDESEQESDAKKRRSDLEGLLQSEQMDEQEEAEDRGQGQSSEYDVATESKEDVPFYKMRQEDRAKLQQQVEEARERAQLDTRGETWELIRRLISTPDGEAAPLDWTSNDDKRKQIFEANFQPSGPEGAKVKPTSPGKCFIDILGPQCLQILLSSTNRAGQEGLKEKWKDISIEELYVFLAISAFMWTCRLRNVRQYWRRNGVLGTSFHNEYGRHMSRTRWLLINRWLTCSNPEEAFANGTSVKTDQRYSSSWRVDKFCKELSYSMSSFYNPAQHLSIDEVILIYITHRNLKFVFVEVMVRCRGRCGFKVKNKMK